MLSLTSQGASRQLFDPARPSSTSSGVARRSRSIHKPAIDRLALELDAREGLTCRFHGGVSWRSTQSLLSKGVLVTVERERGLRIGSHRYVPDLTLRCPRTRKILLLIEVWDSHAVSAKKAQDLCTAGIPWIEVKALHVLARRRIRPLPVLDWGGSKSI